MIFNLLVDFACFAESFQFLLNDLELIKRTIHILKWGTAGYYWDIRIILPFLHLKIQAL